MNAVARQPQGEPVGRTLHHPTVEHRDAFTLVELLVVIAIIAVLAAIILTALSKAKAEAKNTQCLNNLKQLDLCLHLYIVDNNDYFVPNNSIYVYGATSDIQGTSWLPDVDATHEIDPSNIVNGLLFQYNTSLAIYHCPSDESTLKTPSGQPLSQPRWRSYNMSQSVNGYPQGDPEYYQIIPAWSRYTEVRHPAPSDLFVLIDENANTIEDAEFGNPPVDSPWFEGNVWWDAPSDRHSQGANLCFVDGHVEHWKWKVPKQNAQMMETIQPDELPDYQKVQAAMKQLDDDD